MKSWLTITAISISLFSFAQMKAESVKRSADMFDFLNTYYFKGNRKGTSVNYYKTENFTANRNDQDVVKYFYRKNKNHWIKLDLNNDKKTDNLDFDTRKC